MYPVAKTPTPAPIQTILQTVGQGALTEIALYRNYSALDMWKLRALADFFREEDYWRLFDAVRRHWQKHGAH